MDVRRSTDLGPGAIGTWGTCLTLALLTVGSLPVTHVEAAGTSWSDELTFLAGTGATLRVDFPVPSSGMPYTENGVTIHRAGGLAGGGVGAYTPIHPGLELAVSGVEDLDITITPSVRAFGMRLVDGMVASPHCPPADSRFEITILDGTTTLFTTVIDPPVGTLSFFGYTDPTTPFDRVEVREIEGGCENDFLGDIFTGLNRMTWAAGDHFLGGLVVTGNDPGCGLGDAGSFLPADATKAWLMAPGTAIVALPGLLAPRALHGAAAFPEEVVLVVGGTEDCDFAPLRTTEWWGVPPYDMAWRPGPDLLTPRIAPAVAADLGDGAANFRLWVAGGDASGGDPSRISSWHRPTASLELSVPMPGLPYVSGWVQKYPMPAGVTGAAAVWDDATGRLVVSGGAGHPQALARLVQEYEPALDDGATDPWWGAHLPQEAYLTGHTADVCAGSVHVVGGLEGERHHLYHYPGAGVATAVRSGLDTWGLATPLPGPRAYHAAATIGDALLVTGGWDGTALTGTVFHRTCGSGATWSVVETPSAPLRPVAEHGAEVSLGHLYTIGGTGGTGVDPRTTRVEGGCPTDHVLRLDLSAPLLGWGAVASLPTPTAAMGTAVLPDGSLLVVGGRVGGVAADGRASCRIPSADVVRYDPATDTWSPLPDLPEGLIAPGVAAVGWKVVVTGGDETGDLPVASTVGADRMRRPSHDTYLIDLDPGSAAGTAPGWIPLPDAPLGVVFGALVAPEAGGVSDPITGAAATSETSTLYLVAGSHHPNATVRLVQGLQVNTTREVLVRLLPPAIDVREAMTATWLGPHLPAQRVHHALEACGDGRWLAIGGVTSGPVYHTLPMVSAITDSVLTRLPSGGWTDATPLPEARAFPVGSSAATNYPDVWVATGTTPDAHRTNDLLRPC